MRKVAYKEKDGSYSESFDFYVEHKSIKTIKRLHWHDYCEVEFICSGHGEHILNNKVQMIGPGSVFLLTPIDFHRIVLPEGEQMTLYHINFGSSVLSSELMQRITQLREQCSDGFASQLSGAEADSLQADFEQLLQEYKRRSPIVMKDAGMGLTPEDRKVDGLILMHSIESNLCYAGMKRTTNGLLESRKKRREMAQKQVDALQIKLSSVSARASSMSGGNQQKVVVGNWLNNDPQIMIYDEPTRGIDVNAKQQIFEIMWEQSKLGHSSLFVSTEIEELLGVCHRILIMRGGRIVDELKGERLDNTSTNDLYTLCLGG